MLSTILSAIAFDPTIRGILICVVAVVLFLGSIWLILSTNSGFRLGFLLAGSAVFGWMVIMGIIWWIYGIGLVGRSPAWMPIEINFSRDDNVATEVARDLPPADSLPDPADILESYPLVHLAAIATEGADYEPQSLSNVVTIASPLVLATSDDVATSLRPGIEENGEDLLRDDPELARLVEESSDSELAERIAEDAEAARAAVEDQLGGWCLLSESDPRRGEAVASSDAALADASAFGDNTGPSSYIVEDVFFLGGKEPCSPIAEKSTLEQAWHRIATTFQVKNPELHSVVTVTKTQEFQVAPGETPPPPTRLEGASTTSVIMLRNLGNRRFIPFVFTLVSLIFFVIFTMLLHQRDKLAMAARAEFEGKK